MQTVCCYCRRIKQAHGWEKRQNIVVEDRKVSHGCCPDCYRAVRLTLLELEVSRYFAESGRPLREMGDHTAGRRTIYH